MCGAYRWSERGALIVLRLGVPSGDRQATACLGRCRSAATRHRAREVALMAFSFACLARHSRLLRWCLPRSPSVTDIVLIASDLSGDGTWLGKNTLLTGRPPLSSIWRRRRVCSCYPAITTTRPTFSRWHGRRGGIRETARQQCGAGGSVRRKRSGRNKPYACGQSGWHWRRAPLTTSHCASVIPAAGCARSGRRSSRVPDSARAGCRRACSHRATSAS